MTFADLSDAIKRLRERIPVVVAEATNKVALRVIEVASEGTPVDTSKAISNWQVSLNSAISNEIDAHFEGQFGSTKQASLQQVMSSARANLVNRKVGQDIHVVNNADYIEGLNNGTISKQPGLFYEAGIAAGRSQIAATDLRLS